MRDEPSLRGNRRIWPPRERSAARFGRPSDSYAAASSATRFSTPSGSGYEYSFLIASSEDPRRSAPHRKAGEMTTSAQGRRTRDGADTDVVGKRRAGRPRAGVKDLKSITDPAAGSEARRQEGPEAAHAGSGLSR